MRELVLMPNHSVSLSFYGGAGTVTGSKYLISVRGRKTLLDAGLFQGLKEFRLRNWRKAPFDPAQLSTVILSHAHIDHSGYLPLLVRQKFRGDVYCTGGTAELLNILLPDSAHLQEEEASYANRKGYSKHNPALPLYNMKDAEEALKLVTSRPYGKLFSINESMKVMFRPVGHILGASSVEVQIDRGDKFKNPFRIVFSGDMGRWGQPFLRDPEFVPEADVLLIESTYGDKQHPTDAPQRLAQVIHESAQRGGPILIPAFAVGRTQEIISIIKKLENEKKIPVLPVYIDSPMAIQASEAYLKHSPDQKDGMLKTQNFHALETPEESKSLNHVKGPFILISASGMATGGRVLHHLTLRLPDPNTTVLLVGYQAVGTRGRALQDGAKKLKMFGQEIAVNARIVMIEGLSAHGDQKDLLRWLTGFKRPPQRVYVVHGEPEVSQTLAEKIRSQFRWKVALAEDSKTVEFPL